MPPNLIEFKRIIHIKSLLKDISRVNDNHNVAMIAMLSMQFRPDGCRAFNGQCGESDHCLCKMVPPKFDNTSPGI